MAAGKGERLRPQTLQLAKPALPLLNVPMLAYSTLYLELLGAKEYLINTHHLPATVEDAARQVLPRKASLKFSFETEILGSGGGLAQALRMSGATTGPILIANADAILLLPEPEKIQELLQTHVASGALATFLVCPFPPAAETLGGG